MTAADQIVRSAKKSACQGGPSTYVSVGKMGDARALDMIAPEAGSIYVMDRGYVDFRRLNVFHRAGAFFVTRAKRNMNYHRVYSRAVDKTTGVRADQSVALNGFYTRKD